MTTHRNRRTGLFIAIDGPSGVGKSTLARHLAQRLNTAGHDVHLTADPATVHDRLTERGTHNRYQRRSNSSSSEVCYYASAADRLEQAGAPTLRLDTTGLSPALVTDHVLNRIATVSDAASTHTLEPQ